MSILMSIFVLLMTVAPSRRIVSFVDGFVSFQMATFDVPHVSVNDIVIVIVNVIIIIIIEHIFRN